MKKCIFFVHQINNHVLVPGFFKSQSSKISFATVATPRHARMSSAVALAVLREPALILMIA